MKRMSYSLIIALLLTSALRCVGQSNVYSQYVGSVFIENTKKFSNLVMIAPVSETSAPPAAARPAEMVATHSGIWFLLGLVA
jgi:hypothetical protein